MREYRHGAAVSPEADVAARLAGELASEGSAAADASCVGDLSIARQDAGRWRSQKRRTTQALTRLNREMWAEAIIVSVGENLIASVGEIGAEQASELTELASNSTRAADQAAKCLGESGGCFGQSVHEGAR